MSTPITSPTPTSPGQSSPLRPAGQFRAWFTYITDWINGMSPAGASSYETDWIPITIASGYEAAGSTPAVKRVGRDVRFRGAVRRVGAGNWATGLHTVGTVPSPFAPSNWRDAASAIWPDHIGTRAVFGTVDVGTGALQIRIPSDVTNVTAVYLKGLSGYEVN